MSFIFSSIPRVRANSSTVNSRIVSDGRRPRVSCTRPSHPGPYTHANRSLKLDIGVDRDLASTIRWSPLVGDEMVRLSILRE